MMTKNDYEVLASALRPGLNYAERIKVTRLLVPHLLADNGKFNPMLFGESMGLPSNIIKMILTNKEEVDNGRQEDRSQEDCAREEVGIRPVDCVKIHDHSEEGNCTSVFY